MGDDRVIEPFFDLPHIYQQSDWGMHETRLGGDNGGAYTWESPLRDYGQMDRLRFPRIQVDFESTDQILELARRVLGDLLQVRLRARWWWTLGMTWILVNLRGMEQI